MVTSLCVTSFFDFRFLVRRHFFLIFVPFVTSFFDFSSPSRPAPLLFSPSQTSYSILARFARASPPQAIPLPLPPTLDPRGPPRHSTVVPSHSPFEWRPAQGTLDKWWMRPLLLFSYADAQDQQMCRPVTSLCVKRRDRVTSYLLIFFPV